MRREEIAPDADGNDYVPEVPIAPRAVNKPGMHSIVLTRGVSRMIILGCVVPV